MEGFGKIQDFPDGLEVGGILNVGNRWTRGAVGMRMVDDLQIEVPRPHVFERQ